jgi:hypothetical protein
VQGFWYIVPEPERAKRKIPTSRTPRERDRKYIVGSLGMPLNHQENLEKLPKDRPLLVYCVRVATGRLSRRACSKAADFAA